MTMTDRSDPLDDLFDTARRAGADPSAALMDRVMSDALSALPPPGGATRRDTSIWRRLVAGLGGWPALTGLAGAAVAGVWIGVAQPDSLTALIYETETLSVDPLSGFDLVLQEG